MALLTSVPAGSPAEPRPAATRRTGRLRPSLPAYAGRFLLLILALALALFSPLPAAGSTPPGTAEATAGTDTAADAAPVVVFGVPGLSASDVSAAGTPHLWSLAEQSAVGNLAVRAAASTTCPGDGWMTFSTGRRALLAHPSSPRGTSARCAVVADPVLEDETDARDDGYRGAATARNWDQQREANLTAAYSASPGALGQALRDAGASATAIGPGAAIALADETGAIDDYRSPGSALGSGEGLADLTVIDVGAIGTGTWVRDEGFTTDIAGWDEERAGYIDDHGAPAHEVQVRAADETIGRYLEQLPPEATVVVAGLGDSATPSRLRYLSIKEADVARAPAAGLITSPSTRRPGLSQLIDLGPTVMRLLDLEPSPAFQGMPVTQGRDGAATTDERLAQLRQDALSAATIHRSVQAFSIGADIAHYLLAAALGLLFWRRWRTPRWSRLASSVRLARRLAWLGLVMAAVLPGVFLASLLPWSKAASPALGLGAAVAAGTLVMLVPVLVGPWRHSWRGRAGALGGATALLLAADIATGSHLQFNSLLGYNSIVAGRFYGLSNQGVAIFIAAALMAMAVLARWLIERGRRRLALVLTAVAGLISTGVLGNPAWGAKFGGTIATLLGFIVLVLMLAGVRLNLRRLTLIGLISLGTLVGIAGLDYLRPAADRSHFGMFFGQLLNGELLEVLLRKLHANLSIITINPMIALVVPISMTAIVLFLGWLRVSRRWGHLAAGWAGRLPDVLADRSLRAGFTAVLLALLTGMLVADSGVAVPATGLMFFLPLLLCLHAQATQDAAADPSREQEPAGLPTATATAPAGRTDRADRMDREPAWAGPSPAEYPRLAALWARWMPRLRRRRHILAVGALLAAAGMLGTGIALSSPPAATDAAEPPGDPVVLIGVSGLTWDEVTPRETPALHRLAREGGVASLTPRSVNAVSCHADGWLAVNSGRRAADEPREDCRQPGAPLDGQVPDWDVYSYRAEQDNYRPPLGLLSAQTRTVPTAGFGPGAAIALADASGGVEGWQPVPENTAVLGEQVADAAAEGGLVLVDLGNTGEDGYSMSRLDSRVAAVEEALESVAGDPTLVVASLSDGGDDSHMQFFAARGTAFDGAQLSSQSTRQPGLTQTTDVLPTLLEELGLPLPDSLAGAPLHRVDDSPAASAERIQLMRDRDTAVQTQQALATWFYPFYGGLLVLLAGAAVALARLGYGGLPAWLRVLGMFLATVPVSTYLVNLVPWQRSSNPDVAMLGALLGFALLCTALVLLGPWRRRLGGPLMAVSVLTVLVLAADVIAGSPLQMSTIMGEPLLLASRFYGIGNSAFALLSTALVIALTCAVQPLRGRLWRVAVIGAAGLAVCVLLATPGLGTKFGSVPTLIGGLSVLLLGATGIRLSWRRVAIIGGSALTVMTLVLFLDWLRPAGQRTHFGRFFATILDGQAGAVIARKVGMNVDILTQSWFTLLLPLLLAVAFWALLSPRLFRIRPLVDCYARMPMLRTGIGAAVVLLVIGTFVNDSGIVLPAVGALFLAPAMAHLIGQDHLLRQPGSQRIEN